MFTILTICQDQHLTWPDAVAIVGGAFAFAALVWALVH